MGLLVVILVALIALLTLGPLIVFKSVGWVLVVVIVLALIALPFINYSISKTNVEDARKRVMLRRANLQDATEAELAFIAAKATHEAAYPTTTSIRQFFGKDY